MSGRLLFAGENLIVNRACPVDDIELRRIFLQNAIPFDQAFRIDDVLANTALDCFSHGWQVVPSQTILKPPMNYSFTLTPSAFIFRYKWLRSNPSASAARLTLPWHSSIFFRM